MSYDFNDNAFYVERLVYATGVVHSLGRVQCFIVMRASVRVYSFERVEYTIRSEISPLIASGPTVAGVFASHRFFRGGPGTWIAYRRHTTPYHPPHPEGSKKNKITVFFFLIRDLGRRGIPHIKAIPSHHLTPHIPRTTYYTWFRWF